MAGKTSRKSTKVAEQAVARRAGAKPVLLSGGNPQIAKADGDAPVQAYIAAMPSWKRDVGRRLDSLIVRSVPDVRKAVKSGTHPSMALRAKVGSWVTTSSPAT